MNTTLIFEILQLALSLAQACFSGNAKQDIAIGQTLADLVQKGTEAYQQHTGQVLDPSLIKPEETL